ncbi:hypothetical protein P4H61_24850 [Paenibacillus peoriae]|uniref:hypothetical protein n=1 Tax=Paenibacillus peoriae TaxID=59893 RepID=UPI00026C6063|nr:hypothetical protein [Paenibacillus peoriae]MEC0184708.1 hypothetical protein [Paenibacillus peoriae]
MAKRLEGTDVKINGLHPGLIKSSLLKQLPSFIQFKFGQYFKSEKSENVAWSK